MARIVVADDEEPIRDIIREALETEGYEVFLAENGTEALAFVLDENPDLVITDIVMPDMEGIELIRKIGAHSAHIAVIVMSGNPVGSRFLQSAELFGARGSLVKPFSMDELLITVRQVLQNGP